MLRVLLVVPYPKLEETAKKIYTRHFERRDIHMDIRVIKAEEIEEKTLSVDYVPVLVGQKTVGVVITCQTVKKIQQIESQIRKKLSEKGLVANYTFADAIRKREFMEKSMLC